jgi:hypothetical protein
MPPSVQRSNAKHYKSDTITEVVEFEGRAHLMPAQEGWEEVADYALTWALQHAEEQAAGVSALRVTHIGGPTVLLEVAGWRLLTDPTFDAPGRRYAFGWGTASRKLVGPALSAPRSGPSTRCCSPTTIHADNLDDDGRALLPSAGAVVTTGLRRAAARRSRPRSRAVGDHDPPGAWPADPSRSRPHHADTGRR